MKTILITTLFSLTIVILLHSHPTANKTPEKTKSMSKSMERISPLLQVSDLKKSIEFYTKKLGFKEKWFDGEAFAIVSRDDCDIFLGQKQTKVDLRNVTARSKPDGYIDYDLHIHCAVGAADVLWKEFKASGVEIPDKNGPVDREYGIRDFGVIDPDGYVIVFGSPIKGK
jgi:catechol 2,3-dioxygenase-like lactoylglutathione lyase family enzyme